MAGGGNKSPMTGGTAPVQTYSSDPWTPPVVGQMNVPQAPAVNAVPTVGGVNTGIPQGGYAAPAIESYLAGTNVPTLSYDPTANYPWQNAMQQNALNIANQYANQTATAEEAARQAEIAANQFVPGSTLTIPEYEANVATIQNELGWSDYDPTTDVIAGSEYEDAYRNSAAAQEAADTIYNNQIAPGAGNSLESGQYSGTKFLDNVQSGVEHLGQISPIAGVVGDVVSNVRDTPANEFRAESAGARSPMEIAIDREQAARDNYLENNDVAIDTLKEYTGPTINTVSDNDDDGRFMSHEEILELHGHKNKYQNANQGPGATFSSTPEQSAKKAGFDMNDPSTWSAPNDGGGNDDSSGNDSSDDGCVIATYAKSTGVDIGKREAVEWCVSTLHGNFIGETIRKGYQKLGRKKIHAGKAIEHFAEFKRYIDYARGERKDLRAALTFYGRSIQFFVVGLMEK